MQIEINDLTKKQALEVLNTYNGENPYLLDLKKTRENKSFLLITDNQATYILNNHKYEPKTVNKVVEITNYFRVESQKTHNLTTPFERIFIENIIGETEKALHCFVKFYQNQKKSQLIWFPKSQLNEDLFKICKEVDVDWTKYELRPPLEHQKEAVLTLLKNDKFLLADAPGVGKTLSAIIASLEHNPQKVLIVCPASLKLNWRRELMYYVDESEISVITKEWNPKRFTIINYDILQKFNHIEPTKVTKKKTSKIKPKNNEIISEGFEQIILDECHLVKNKKSNRSQHILKICKSIPKRWLLTGTPITNKPIDLFNLLTIIEHPMALNWQSFIINYCNAKRINIRGRLLWKYDGASNLDELNRRIKNIMLRRKKEDVLDMPNKYIRPIYVELPDKKKYNNAVEEYILWRLEQGKNVSYARKLVELSVLRRFVAENKIPYTIELVENALENDQKVIIFTDYHSVVEQLENHFKESCVTLHGGTTQTNRQLAVDEFQNNPNIRVFIGNTIAAGVGITLTAAEVVIVNDLNWQPSNVDQSLDRAYRYGQTKDVTCFFPLFDDSVDTIVYEILDKKRSIINDVIDGKADVKIDGESMVNEIIDRIEEKYRM